MLGELIPIVAIAATAAVILEIIRFKRAKYGVSATPAAEPVETARENARLARENETLRLTVERMEERLAVLERIATDPAERTAREIERLR